MFDVFSNNCPSCTCQSSMSSQSTVQRVRVYVRCPLNQLSNVYLPMFSDFLINCPACTCLCSMSSQPTVQRVQVYVRCLLNQLSSVHVTMFDVVSINYPTYRPTSCFVFDLTDRSQQFSVYVSCCGQSYLIRSQLFTVHVSSVFGLTLQLTVHSARVFLCSVWLCS